MEKQYTLEEIRKCACLIVPGNIILRGGSRLFSEEIAWHQDAIYEKGKDMVLDGAVLKIAGEVFVGGDVILMDTESEVAAVDL